MERVDRDMSQLTVFSTGGAAKPNEDDLIDDYGDENQPPLQHHANNNPLSPKQHGIAVKKPCM
jgi:hypothetical protein